MIRRSVVNSLILYIILFWGLVIFFNNTLAKDEPGDKVSVSVDMSKRDFSQPVRDPNTGTRIQKTRAFWGAPPPVPHQVTSQRDNKACLGCHAREKNLREKKRDIAPVPHEEFSQCLQCHVPGKTNANSEFKPNEFVGLDFPGKGSRASETSPPTIPHHTFMRDNCQSCHGPSGDYAVRTPHPERSQCRQCHVAEATQTRFFPVQDDYIEEP